MGNFNEHKDKMRMEVEVEVGEMGKYRLVRLNMTPNPGTKCEGKVLHKCRCHPSIVNPSDVRHKLCDSAVPCQCSASAAMEQSDSYQLQPQ